MEFSARTQGVVDGAHYHTPGAHGRGDYFGAGKCVVTFYLRIILGARTHIRGTGRLLASRAVFCYSRASF